MSQLELSTLILCKDVPFNNTYETTIDFASVTEQVNFFKTYRFNNVDINTTYLRTHRRIEVEYLRDDLFGVNYCMIYNYDKWYFYFITDKEYINENCTALTIEMDVFQTYMFDYTLGECFVDREHQDRFDLYGNATFNLEPENVEVGKTFKINKRYSVDPEVRFDSETGTFQDRSSLVWVYVWCTDPLARPTNTSQYPEEAFNNSSCINDFPTNAWCYVFPTFLDFDDFKSKHQLSPAITNYEIKGPNASNVAVILDTNNVGTGSGQHDKRLSAKYKISELASNPYVFNIAISAYPPVGVTATYSQLGNTLIISIDKTTGFYPIRYQEASTTLYTASDCDCYYVANQKVEKFDARIYDSESETPLVSVDLTKNKNYPVYAMSQYLAKNIDYEPKLNTSPYLLYTLKYGDKEIDLAPELMTDKNFYFFKSATPTSDVLIYNKDYAGSDIGLTGQLVSPFACTVPQRTDPYKQYWATSRASYYTGMLVQGSRGIRGLIKSVTSGNPLKMLNAAIEEPAKTAEYVMEKQAMVQDLSNAPDTMTNTGDDVGVQLIYSPLSAYIMVKEILPQFKNKLFNFLYRYGYACNTYKTPNLKTRYWFNFIQMTDVVFKTNKVDSDYVDQLKSIFQKGTTIWHYHDIANYKTNYLYNYTNENLETSLL